MSSRENPDSLMTFLSPFKIMSLKTSVSLTGRP